MTLIEYDRKFEKLCKYVPKLVDIEEEKARLFENGLNEWLYDAMVAQHLPTYSVVFQRAQKLEEG